MRIARAATAALVIVATLTASALDAAGQDRWRPLPGRSRQQYEQGLVGGAGEQHMHSIARCASRPDIVYLSHDCAQMWRSEDGGRTWLKPAGSGLYVAAGQSIEVDPVKPNVVLFHCDASWNWIAESQEGLYRSSDYGESWDLVLPVQSEAQRIYQHAIAYDPASVTPDGAQRWYFGVLKDGLYVSEDAGVTWTRRTSLTSRDNVYTVQCHISDGQTVYLGTEDGLVRSTNRGQTVSALGNLPSGKVTCIAPHPTDAATLYVVVQGEGLYRSTNGGSTFARLVDIDATGVFVNPGHPEVMYLSSLNTTLRVSHDAGATWSTPEVIPPPGFEDTWKDDMDGGMTGISPDPRHADQAMGYSHGSLYRTEDGGASFFDSSALFTGWNWGWWTDSVEYDVADPNRFYFFCADIGMCFTENGGLWFESRTVPWQWYSGGQVSWRGQHAGALYPETGSDLLISMVGMYWSTKLIRSTDGGDSFSIVDNRTENHLFIAFNTDNPSIVYAGDKRSTDGGQSFAEVAYLAPYNGSIVGMCRAQPDTVYALSGDRYRLFRSDDAGASWYLYAEPWWDLRGVDSKPVFEPDPVDPDVVYAIGPNDDLARFDGATWTELGVKPLAGAAPHRNYVHCVRVDPRYPNVIYAGMFAAGGPQIFRSVDGGAAWEDITFNHPKLGSPNFSVHPLTGDLMTSSCAGTRVFPPPYASAESIYPNGAATPPTADAGEDVTVYDTDGDGYALVWLDGTGSTSPDNLLAEFLWTDASGAQAAAGSLTVEMLPLGSHELTLRVVDADGLGDTDVVRVDVVAGSPEIPGDADGDGQVNLSDFVILKNNFGRTDASWADGDFDGDGDVDLADFVILKNNFGA